MSSSNQQSRSEWKGYTLDELVYHRAIALARIEVQKEKLSQDYSRMRVGNFNFAPSSFTRALGVMNYLDYAIIAFRLLRKLGPLLHRKKK